MLKKLRRALPKFPSQLLPSKNKTQTHFRFFSALQNAQNEQKSYYEILRLPTNANTEQIRRQFFELAKLYHPDVSSGLDSNANFQQLAEAYGVLSNAELRKEYDRAQGFALPPDPLARLRRAPTEEEFNKQYAAAYKSAQQAKDDQLFKQYFREKFVERDWEIKDPADPLNFHISMFERKREADAKTAQVR